MLKYYIYTMGMVGCLSFGAVAKKDNIISLPVIPHEAESEKVVSVFNNTPNSLYVMHYNPPVGSGSGHKYITLPTLKLISYALKDQIDRFDSGAADKSIEGAINTVEERDAAKFLRKELNLLIKGFGYVGSTLSKISLLKKGETDATSSNTFVLKPLSKNARVDDVINAYKEIVMPHGHLVTAYRFDIDKAMKNADYVNSKLKKGQKYATNALLDKALESMGLDKAMVKEKLSVFGKLKNALGWSSGKKDSKNEAANEQAIVVSDKKSKGETMFMKWLSGSKKLATKALGSTEYGEYALKAIVFVEKFYPYVKEAYKGVKGAVGETRKVYSNLPFMILDPKKSDNLSAVISIDKKGVLGGKMRYGKGNENRFVQVKDSMMKVAYK
jgi:hypothetical protein